MAKPMADNNALAQADRIMQEFYLSDAFDPKAERHADTVKAAIAFALRTPAPASGEVEELVKRVRTSLERAADTQGLRDDNGYHNTADVLDAVPELLDMLERLAQAGGDQVLPEYGHWLPEVWEQYLRDLVGWEDADRWAKLPATFRWHEFHERLNAAIAAMQPTSLDGEG